MSRQCLIMGNWKMHGTQQRAESLLTAISHIKTSIQVEIAIFPPYIYLEKTRAILEKAKIYYGAQNVSAYSEGAYTGEIAASMLKDIGCRYVLVGHSERRVLFHEDNHSVAQKFLLSLEAGLQPVLCVGETAKERAAGKTEEIILAQLESVLNLSVINHAFPWVIAYEPVWAIGTGQTATPEEAQAIHRLLREALARENKALSVSTPIIYGGSVKASNAAQLFAMPDIDGVLIGGASLNAEEFRTICHMAE